MGGEVGVDSRRAGQHLLFQGPLGPGKGAARELAPVPALRGCRVLVVDDNDKAWSILPEMLEA